MKNRNTKLIYPIKADYVNEWGLVEALRELVANGLDGEQQHGAKFSYTYDPKKKVLELRNSDVHLPIEALFFGGSDKTDDSKLIGKYGEGLKLALLVLTREQVKVSVRNAKDVWAVKFVKLHGQDVLSITVKEGVIEGSDFVVTVKDVPDLVWRQTENLFLRLKPGPVLWENADGAILGPELGGNIYVQGVFCTHMPKYNMGYNIADALDTGRDRRMPSYYILQDAIGSLLRKWVRESPTDTEAGTLYADRIAKAYQLLADGTEDGLAMELGSHSGYTQGLLAIWKSLHGDAVPVLTEADRSMWEEIGHKAQRTSRPLFDALRWSFPQYSEAQLEYESSVREEFTPDMLTDAERRTLAEGIYAVQFALEERYTPAKIVLFAQEYKLSSTKDGQLLVSRMALANSGLLITTWLREYAKGHSLDGQAAVQIKYDNALGRVITKALQDLREAGVPSPRLQELPGTVPPPSQEQAPKD